MGLFSKSKLKVRLNEEVGFAGPIMFEVQVKGGDFGRFFWSKLPGTSSMEQREAYRVASDYAIKHKCRFVPR